MLLRRVAKSVVASAMSATRADRLLHRLAGEAAAPLVLGYHRVVDDFDRHASAAIPPMLTSRRMLEQHLDWLAGRYRFVSLDELAARMESGRPFEEPVAALTFDDGYRDIYDQVFPVVRARGIPAAVFVATDFVSRRVPLAHDRLYLLVTLALRTTAGREVLAQLLPGTSARRWSDRGAGDTAYFMTACLLGALPRAAIAEAIVQLETALGVSEYVPAAEALTWPMLAELAAGSVTIGFHTASHTALTNERAEVVADELGRSRAILEKRLGREVRYFAYPNGRFNRAVVRAVSQAGARLAFTSCRHVDAAHPHLTVSRRLLWQQSCVGPSGAFSPAVMSAHLNGVFDCVTPCLEDHAADPSVVSESSRAQSARAIAAPF